MKDTADLLLKALSNDETRYHLQGIYHDPERRVAVATDGHILVTSKTHYIPALANQVYLPKTLRASEEVGGTWKRLNYRQIVPTIDPILTGQYEPPTIKSRSKIWDNDKFYILESEVNRGWWASPSDDPLICFQQAVAKRFPYGKIAKDDTWYFKYYGPLSVFSIENSGGSICLYAMPYKDLSVMEYFQKQNKEAE